MPILIVLIPFLVIYPFFIAKNINKRINSNKCNIKKVLSNLGLLFLLSFVTFCIIAVLFGFYLDLTPHSSSNLCQNQGGWIYSCLVDSRKASIIITLLGGAVIIHHFRSLKFIYNIFEYSNKIFNYLFMYIYMGIIYFLNFWYFIFLYGVMGTVYFDSPVVELFRIFVTILPSALFIISIFIFKYKNKN